MYFALVFPRFVNSRCHFIKENFNLTPNILGHLGFPNSVFLTGEMIRVQFVALLDKKMEKIVCKV